MFGGHGFYGGEPITLTRDVEAIEVPSGGRITLPAGTQVEITQALGDTYTVMTDRGYMVRIAGRNADALGKEVPAAAADGETTPTTKEQMEEAVWDRLRTVYDPEIPVNIADLGLVYRCAVDSLPDEGYRVEVEMTLTAPGCGMGDVLKAEVEDKLQRIPGAREIDVELVFDPPWDLSMMPEAARLQLGLL